MDVPHTPPPTGDAEERLRAFVASGPGRPPPRIVPLTGDASDRRYFRLVGADGRSTIVALHTAPFRLEALPFVNVAELLRRVPLPVPEILGHDEDLGILVLEDLGDVTLQAHLGAASPIERARLYRDAVDLIVALQERGAALASATYVPFGLAFDAQKLNWELDFFLEHFVGRLRDAPTSGFRAIRHEFAALSDELAAEPRVLCHRDFHSRNLMFHQGRLYVIDFQDARMGPDTYDLVSLLRDSYADLPDALVTEAVDRFLSGKGESTTIETFTRRFDLMALQRNLKALGTFGYQIATRHNPVYLQYIPRTLRYVRENLRRNRRFDRLGALLGPLVEELRPVDERPR